MAIIDIVVPSHENPEGEIMQLLFDCIAINYLTQKCTIVCVLRFSNMWQKLQKIQTKKRQEQSGGIIVTVNYSKLI